MLLRGKRALRKLNTLTHVVGNKSRMWISEVERLQSNCDKVDYNTKKRNMKLARELKVTGDCGGTFRYEGLQNSNTERKEMFMYSGSKQTPRS